MARESISASYSSGTVRLQGAGEKCRVRVIDTKGTLITAATVAQRQFAFKDKPSGVYVVMVSDNNIRPVAFRIIVP